MEKNFKADKLFVRVFDTRAEMGAAAASDISAGIKIVIYSVCQINGGLQHACGIKSCQESC